LNELSIFTGAGGGVLGTKLLGFKHIGYVEYDSHCQKTIKQRIQDGILDAAPIFGDIRNFISEGYAAQYSGMVDVLTAGFPCQPFSVAGKGEGENDPRNMWPQTIECIRLVRPRLALLENVPGLLVHRYMGRIIGDLAEARYDAKWCVLGADYCRAEHRRKRLWILANTNEVGRIQARPFQKIATKNKAIKVWGRSIWTNILGLDTTRLLADAYLDGNNDGVADRVDRIAAIGNGQVPAVVATVWRLLNDQRISPAQRL